MIRASIAFFILGIVAYVVGATGLAGLSVDIGETLLVVFLVFAAISFVAAMVTGKKPQALL